MRCMRVRLPCRQDKVATVVTERNADLLTHPEPMVDACSAGHSQVRKEPDEVLTVGMNELCTWGLERACAPTKLLGHYLQGIVVP